MINFLNSVYNFITRSETTDYHKMTKNRCHVTVPLYMHKTCGQRQERAELEIRCRHGYKHLILSWRLRHPSRRQVISDQFMLPLLKAGPPYFSMCAKVFITHSRISAHAHVFCACRCRGVYALSWLHTCVHVGLIFKVVTMATLLHSGKLTCLYNKVKTQAHAHPL